MSQTKYNEPSEKKILLGVKIAYKRRGIQINEGKIRQNIEMRNFKIYSVHPI